VSCENELHFLFAVRLVQFPRSAKIDRQWPATLHLPIYFSFSGSGLIIRFSQVPTRIIVSLTVFRSGWGHLQLPVFLIFPVIPLRLPTRAT